MQNSSKMLLLFVLLLVGVELTTSAALSDVELKKYKHLIEGQGLYSPEDDVKILTADNFKSEIYGNPHAHIVEFYNSWCGFCQRYASTWKALATVAKDWRAMVVVSAIDCSDEDNTPICRDFEIMAYPTLRYFHERYPEASGQIGHDVPKGDDVFSQKLNLFKQIIIEQKQGRGQIYPTLLPFTDPNPAEVFDSAPAGSKFVFLIAESAESLLGADIALDLKDVASISVRYFFPNNTEVLKALGGAATPALFAVDEEHKSHLVSTEVAKREDVHKAIRDFLTPKMILLPEPTPQKIFTGKWIDVEVPNVDALMEAHARETLKKKINKMGDVVFQADLETGLRYSLKHEVALQKGISGGKLDALLAYVGVLAKYFPFGQKGRTFLLELKGKLEERKGGSVGGEEVARWISEAEEEGRMIFSSAPQWVGCGGSTGSFRGYPCSLWTLFHYLTVNAAEQGEGAKPREVLEAMLGYVGEFFGCADCSRHFKEMAQEKGLKGVASLDSAVLWLWMAHNTVNKRLAGDPSEDPEYPKTQYPRAERCPSCRNGDGTWNLTEVLLYLRHVYSNINVRYIGSDTRILHMGLEGASSRNDTSLFQKIDATGVQEKDVRARSAGEGVGVVEGRTAFRTLN